MHQQWSCKSHFWIKIFLVYWLPFNNRTNLSAASQLIFSMWLMHELRRCWYPCFIGGHSMILLAEWNIYRLTTKCWYWSVFERNYLVASVYLPRQINPVGFLATWIPKKYFNIPRSFIWKQVLRQNLKRLIMAQGLLQAIIESST